MIRLFVGFDPREAIAFHVFVQSVIEHSSEPVSIVALTETALGDQQRDGSNAFVYSRFLVPALTGFSGRAIFADGDMLIERDIAELWRLRDERYAVQVIKHDYRTRHPIKYIGSAMEAPNVDYPAKNWSSVILWNCSHPSNACLTREYVENATGAHLHRFQWLQSKEIGALPSCWNQLVGEDPPGDAALRHFTLGVPGIRHYATTDHAVVWHRAMLDCFRCAGEPAADIVARAATLVVVNTP